MNRRLFLKLLGLFPWLARWFGPPPEVVIDTLPDRGERLYVGGGRDGKTRTAGPMSMSDAWFIYQHTGNPTEINEVIDRWAHELCVDPKPLHFPRIELRK